MANEPDMTCDSALDNLVAYVQEELSDDELVRKMEGHLAECGICRRQEAEVRRTLQMVRETYHEFVPSDRVWQDLLRKLHSLKTHAAQGAEGEAEESAGLTEPPAGPAIAARTGKILPKNRRALAAVISVAAVIVLIVGIVVVVNLSGFSLVLQEGKSVSVFDQSGQSRAAQPGQSIDKGWRVKTAESPAVLEYRDGSTLEMSANTALTVTADKEISLEKGKVMATILPSSNGYTVRTDFGDAQVQGTKFSVEVSRDEMVTTVRVMEGSVTFVNEKGQQVVEEGKWSRAERDAAPETPHTVVQVAGQSPINPDTVEVSISVFDGQEYIVQGDARRPVIKAGDALVVRFQVTNNSDKEMNLPTGRTNGILLGVQGLPASQDITTMGEMVSDKEEPATTEEEMVVKIAPQGAYRFEYRIPAEKLKFMKGGEYKIHGYYYLVGSRTITIEVK